MLAIAITPDDPRNASTDRYKNPPPSVARARRVMTKPAWKSPTQSSVSTTAARIVTMGWMSCPVLPASTGDARVPTSPRFTNPCRQVSSQWPTA